MTASIRVSTAHGRWWQCGFTLLVLAAGLGTVPVTAGANATPPASPLPAPTPVVPADDLGRGTPRTAMRGYLDACHEGDYQRAAEYLDLRRINPKDRATQGPILARHLKVVLDHTLSVDPEELSDQPEGDTADGLPAHRERVGMIRTAKDAVAVLLERVRRDDGVPIWKISSLTVARIPDLYGEFGYGLFGDTLPAPFFEIVFLDVELWQWIGLSVLLLVSLLVSWMVTALTERLIKPLVLRLHQPMEDKLERLIAGPLRLAAVVTVFYAGSFLLALALPVRAFLNDAAKALVIAALTWLVLRVIDMMALRVEDRLMARKQAAAVSMLPLARRTAKSFLIAVALLALLQNFGFDVTGLLAGLGVGGLAVALAAQETVKNFFGGVALITDQPVRVGDLCRFGDKTGTVEDISIWSTRVRTLERSVVSVPNGQFAAMPLENLSRRDRMWLHATIGLQYDTTADQLRQVLEQIRTAIEAHPHIDRDSARARFTAFSGPSLQIEISAYLLTSHLSEFLVMREELFLEFMEIIRKNGARLVAT